MRFPPIITRPIEDYFSEIYGLEHVKQTLIDACKTNDSVAILLWGPPQSAKTLFLEAIARYFGFNNGIPFMIDRATPAGLAELFAERYRVYVFDEIDKAKPETLRVFNEAVEHKRVSFVKHKTNVVIKLPENTKFFVGANSLSVLREKVPETVTRFLDIPLPPMTFEYFKEIVYLQLRKRGYVRQQTDYIAAYAWKHGFRDVRKIRELGKIYQNGRVNDILRFIAYWFKTRQELTQQSSSRTSSPPSPSQPSSRPPPWKRQP
ncbi:MAG: ATP-binding protein [Nitrososphaerota archaeon]